MFYYRTLPEDMRKAYKTLYEGICRLESKIILSVDVKKAVDVFMAVNHDHPELFYLDIVKSRYRGQGTMTEVTVRYHKSLQEIKHVRQQLDGFEKDFIREVLARNLKESERIRYVHNFVIKNAVYNQKARETGKIVGNPSSITGVLFENSAVCSGLSMTVKYLLDLLKIPSAVCSGRVISEEAPRLLDYSGKANEVNHAFNLVLCKGRWQFMDVTMDIGQTRDIDHPSYDFFLRGKPVFDRYLQMSPLPVRTDEEADSIFVRKELIFSDEDSLIT